MRPRIIIYILILNYCFTQDKGKKAFDNKDYEASFQYYKTILEKRKNDNFAKYGAGVAAYKKKDLESAKYFLNEAKNSDDKILGSLLVPYKKLIEETKMDITYDNVKEKFKSMINDSSVKKFLELNPS